MGRRKNELGESASYRELALWLREIRDDAGLTYRQMARRAAESGCPPVSAVTLSRADNGALLPKPDVVEAYAIACGVQPGKARRMWAQAARPVSVAERGGVLPVPRRRARSLDLVCEPAQLLQLMHQLCVSAGNPSLRELQKRAAAGAFGPLPRSTLGDVLAGLRLPSERLLVSYVRTCGEPEHRVDAWTEALSRASGRQG